MATSAVHYLTSVGGLDFPLCHSKRVPLDMKKAYLDASRHPFRVTCLKFRRMMDEKQD